LEGSVVSDASIIPVVPAANSMLLTIMTAERIAQAMKAAGNERVGSVAAKLWDIWMDMLTAFTHPGMAVWTLTQNYCNVAAS